YQVEVAYDGTAAIRLDGDFHPMVAVLDIGMPGANGFEVARSIRENRGAGVTLIALTGWGQEGDRRRAMEAGFDYHLTKPVDPGALNDLLVEVAEKERKKSNGKDPGSDPDFLQWSSRRGTLSSAGPPVSASIHSATPLSDSASCSDSPAPKSSSVEPPARRSASASARVTNGPRSSPLFLCQ